MLRSAITRWGLVAVAIVACTLFVGSNAIAGPATHTEQPINFNTFIPCANDGAGEVVAFSSTLHLTFKDGVVTHGHQTGVSGVGTSTGDGYLGTASPANLNPAGDGAYLYHLTYIGKGRNGAKFTITAKGFPLQPAIEVIQVHCH